MLGDQTQQTKNHLAYSDYVALLNTLAQQCGMCPEGKQYCEPDAWRDAYDNGLTVGEAWAEEVAAAQAFCAEV